MIGLTNHQVLLAKHPEGDPTLQDFKINRTTVPELKDGEILVQALYLSVDPGMRGMMGEGGQFPLNEVMTGRSVGRVIESKNKKFNKADIVYERLGWQNYSISNGENTQKINPDLAPISAHLGILGVPGLCGYFGLFEIGHPKKGETVVVSGASGAVGSAAGQIAKAEGCRVVGIAGSDEKNNYLENELGFDATINYKTTNDMKKSLQEACPNGIDIYFDTIGGEITHTALALINYHARVIICGQTSQYNLKNPPKVSGNLNFLIKKSALMEGFVVYDYEDKNDEAIAYLEKLIREDKLKYKENIVDDIENAPQAFIDLFKGNSFGKQLVRVAE